MGNKSSFQKREKRIRELFGSDPKKIHPKSKQWENVRDLSKSAQPRTFMDWPGMKEKSAALGRRMHGVAPVLTRSIFYRGHKPLRNTRPVMPEVNRTPQPWQRKVSRENTAAA